MMTRARGMIPLVLGLTGVLAVGCGSSDDNNTNPAMPDTGGTGTTTQTLCAKYGKAVKMDETKGYDVVKSVVGSFVQRVAGDCRINAFFVSLPPDRLAHLTDCLSKQVGEVFACPSVKYDCRSMKDSHMGLGIRGADFDALVDDLVATMKASGVEQQDQDALLGKLGPTRGDIVTDPAAGNDKPMCPADAGADGG